MKFNLSARTCSGGPEGSSEPQKNLEFFLEETDYRVQLKVTDLDDPSSDSRNIVFYIDKATGKAYVAFGLNEKYGLPIKNNRIELGHGV